MTQIKVNCRDCGSRELVFGPHEIQLMVCSHAPRSYFEFVCTECSATNRRLADDEAISLLVSGGVHAQVWELPAEVLEERPGPRLQHDDLLDFMLQLERTDLVAAVAGAQVST